MFWETVLQEKEARMGEYDPGVTKFILDIYESYPINYAIRAKYWGTPKFQNGLTKDEKIVKVFEEAIDKYLSEEDAKFLREAKTDLEPYLKMSEIEIMKRFQEAAKSGRRYDNPILLRKK